jgi:hypothetical protein
MSVVQIIKDIFSLSHSQILQWEKEEGQTIQWPKEEGQKIHWPKEEGQTIHWPKEEQTIQWPKEKENKTNNRPPKTENERLRIRTQLNTCCERICPGMEYGSYFTGAIGCVTHVYTTDVKSY